MSSLNKGGAAAGGGGFDVSANFVATAQSPAIAEPSATLRAALLPFAKGGHRKGLRVPHFYALPKGTQAQKCLLAIPGLPPGICIAASS